MHGGAIKSSAYTSTSQNHDILSQMQDLLDKLKLKSSCDTIPASEAQKNTSDCCDFDDDLERKIRLCSSLKEIREYFRQCVSL